VRLLVTGGSGFIGSHVADKAIAAGHDVVVLDTRESPYGVETILGDVTDLDDVAAAARGVNAIVHLAAMADVNEVTEAPVTTEAVNSRGTLAVLEAARAERCRVVYASTIWVYGENTNGVATEDSPLGIPRHFYTATKLAGEMYCHSYGELYGVEHTILRFGIPYGPRARPAAVLPAFVQRAHEGEPLTIAGTGGQSRRFVYVEDLAEGVVAALAPGAANRTYNLVGDESVTILEIAQLVRELVQPVEIVHLEGRKGDFPGVEVSGARAARELGWRATTPFAEGARRYVEWFLASSSTASAANGSVAKSA
jgi:UDP-glucose 4-epimerase